MMATEDIRPTGLPDPAAEGSDVPFAARYARQKIDRFLTALEDARAGRANGSNTEVMRKLDSAERHAIYNMRGAVGELHELLNPQPNQESKAQ